MTGYELLKRIKVRTFVKTKFQSVKFGYIDWIIYVLIWNWTGILFYFYKS
jgi:hypothetical protein